MSRNGQPRLSYPMPKHLGAVAVASLEMYNGQRFPTHSHPVHQLAWSERGVLAITLDDQTWVLPPNRALWIPRNLLHATQASSPTMMRSLYFRERSAPVRWQKPTVVAVSPLLRELICFLANAERNTAAARHARSLLGRLLVPLSTARIELPMPRDPRARRVAEALTQRSDDPRTLSQLGKLAGASARTLARLFLSETALTFGNWRTQLRLTSA
ncbi:MAG TPA: helix-turn-helix transcriptional regulator, partial [Polyangiales bacterium]|nr:helix-turn-helix transcriptional regulator [Polyangiales bacterium]